MDWSSENQLAVALDRSVYIWNANTESVTELTRLGDLNQVTSLAWSQ
jgi:WD40 repeat protein